MPLVGPRTRIDATRKRLGFLPPWRCDSITKGRFYLCGHCFGLLGDGPATNGAEMWMNGTDRAGVAIVVNGVMIVPVNVWCEKCGGPAWPSD